MSEITITDHVINYRGGDPRYPTWELTADGTRIGTVWETETGYAGQISGTNASGDHRQYTCPEKPFRQAVIDRLDIMAARLGIA